MTLPERLEAAVRAADGSAVRALLADLAEPERADLLAVTRSLVAEVLREGVDAVSRLGPILLAAYGVLPVSDLRRLGWRSNHVPAGLEEVLRRRSPERLEPIVGHLLDDVGGRAWSAVRSLVREGVLPAPDRPSYTVALLASTRYRDPADVVAADPGLLDDEVWRLFEVEGGGENSLASHEKYTGDRWGDYFRGLAAGGPALRRRLLDASLAALARDFATFRAGWFSRFHESLAPTDEERAERAEAYLGLLRSRPGPTLSFAVAALGRISRADRLRGAGVLEALEPGLMVAPAGTAKAALEIVRRVGEEPALAREAAVVAAAALAHPSPDVQRAALRVVGSLTDGPDEAVAGAVAERLPEVAASQRSAALELLARLGGGVSEAAVPGPPDLRATPKPTSMGRPSPLDPSRAIAPLGTLDELVDMAVSVVESGEPADDVERVLEAVGRFGADRPDGFDRLTAALARRARHILSRDGAPFSGFDPRADMAAVLLAWTSGEAVGPSDRFGRRGPGAGAGAFLSARARELALAVAARAPFLSVAAPTHRGGWIDPRVLVQRLATRPPASRLDLVAALLRSAAQRRDEALRAAALLEGEVGAVTRYALGGDEPIGPTAAWWVAAARVRAPGEDDERLEGRHPRLGPDAGLAARIAFPTREAGVTPDGLVHYGGPVLEAEPRPAGAVAADLPTVLIYRTTSSFAVTGRSEPAMLRWIATIQPGYREPWAAVGSATLAGNVDWWAADWADRAFLEPFVDPVTALGAQARRLVGIALGAKEAGERGLAGDIVRLALADGRLAAGDLAEGLRASAALGCDRPNRWALALADVASASDAHAREVAEAIGGCLAALTDRPAARLVPLLRLLDELLAGTGTSAAPACREMLACLAPQGGQAGRLARAILSRG